MFFLILIFGSFLYFLPTIAAASNRHHQAGAIFILNLFLGWTFLGWVMALVWSCTATKGAETLHPVEHKHSQVRFGAMLPQQRSYPTAMLTALVVALVVGASFVFRDYPTSPPISAAAAKATDAWAPVIVPATVTKVDRVVVRPQQK